MAIIDIDQVAREIGADKEFLSALKQAQDKLNAKLKETQVAMQKKFDEAVTQAGGDKASDEKKQQLAQFNQQLQNQFAQYKGQAQTALKQEQAKRVLAFRELVRPVAMEVAKSKGLSVVLQKTEQVIAFQEAVDITSGVAAKLKAQEAAKPKKALKASPSPKATPIKKKK
ncbi:MAG: hypothetical protein GXP30_05480 [Verrucomicrobia bacterium]|nr:hypothetical protein [Verrucomicrobiota bacterium]